MTCSRTRTRTNRPGMPCRTRKRQLALLLATCVVVGANQAHAQSPEPRRQLASALSELTPYDMEGGTLDALGDLGELRSSLDRDVAATARFVRAAALVDLLTHARISETPALRQSLAAAVGTGEAELESAILEDLDTAMTGPHHRPATAYRTLVPCINAESSECSTVLARIARRRGPASGAARLLSLGQTIDAIVAARTMEPSEAEATLVTLSVDICEEPGTAELSDLCRRAQSADRTARQRLSTLAVENAMASVSELVSAEAMQNPLMALSSQWLDTMRSRLGWIAMPGRPDLSGIDGLRLPNATAESNATPMSLLLWGSSGVSVALGPVLALNAEGSQRLDEVGGAPLPGRRILRFPHHFRPALRPIAEVTVALTELRADRERAVAPLGNDVPAWLEAEATTLGLLVDPEITLVDLTRLILSAREAGFESFRLVGQRSDGALAAFPVSFESLATGGRRLPFARVGPTDVTVGATEGPPTVVRRSNRAGIGQAMASRLSPGNNRFVVQGRPMMTLRLVFPSIDAVNAAAPDISPQCTLLLPP